jgi:hypothetical protein
MKRICFYKRWGKRWPWPFPYPQAQPGQVLLLDTPSEAIRQPDFQEWIPDAQPTDGAPPAAVVAFLLP